MAQYPESWRIYFEDHPDPHAIFTDAETLTAYCDTIPTDIAFKIVNQDAQVVYQFAGRPLPMAYAYRDAWKDTQSYPHGRKTAYSRAQEQLRPSAYRRKDANGEYK